MRVAYEVVRDEYLKWSLNNWKTTIWVNLAVSQIQKRANIKTKETARRHLKRMVEDGLVEMDDSFIHITGRDGDYYRQMLQES